MTAGERSDGRIRQKQIIDVSLDIIDKEGIHGLTLKKIGAALGISDAALLRHFRSKEEIVEAMAQKVFFESVVKEDRIAGADVKEKLTTLMTRQFEIFDSYPQSTSVLFQEDIFREYPEIRDWFIKRRDERHEKIAFIVRKGQDLGEIDVSVDPDAFATLFMGTMRMAVMDWRDSGYAWKLSERAPSLLKLLLRSLER